MIAGNNLFDIAAHENPKTLKSPVILAVLIDEVLHRGVDDDGLAAEGDTRQPLQTAAGGPLLMAEKGGEKPVKVSRLDEPSANERCVDVDDVVGHANDEAAIQHR